MRIELAENLIFPQQRNGPFVFDDFDFPLQNKVEGVQYFSLGVNFCSDFQNNFLQIERDFYQNLLLH